MRRIPLLLIVVALLVPLAPVAAPAQAAPAAEPATAHFAYFEETGHNVGLQIKSFYDANGGLAIFGLPLTEAYADPVSGLIVQYFERARFELHPTGNGPPRVELALAGSIVAAGRNDPPFAWLSRSPDPARDFFPESGHTLGGAFRWFWQSNGGLPVFGYPISEEFYEVSPVDGQTYLVQYFQRARFEYHPEHAGTPYEVLLSPLGRELLARDPAARAATAPARPIELLGEATTGFATSASERTHNIERAAAMFHGVVVAPGEEFSFNSIGDFSAENGFVDGYAIVGGRLERVIGGGLCQVSTTMFRAVANAGLEITNRVGHSYIVYFYENILGFDATVFSPTVDFRWRNDTGGPVYITTEARPTENTVTFWVWGYSDGRTVSYDGPYTRNWRRPGTPVWQYDASLPTGAVRQLVHGRSGVDVTYIRTVTLPNGAELRSDNFFTRYQPWEDFYVYGPGVTPPAGVRVVAPR